MLPHKRLDLTGQWLDDLCQGPLEIKPAETVLCHACCRIFTSQAFSAPLPCCDNRYFKHLKAWSTVMESARRGCWICKSVCTHTQNLGSQLPSTQSDAQVLLSQRADIIWGRRRWPPDFVYICISRLDHSPDHEVIDVCTFRLQKLTGTDTSDWPRH